jgi:hypothetical protein
MEKQFDNKDRNRYYGLRIGDIVDLKGADGKVCQPNAEVIEYGSDNNRVEVRLMSGNTCDWVAEWCDIVVKVENRIKEQPKPTDEQIIEKLALKLNNNGNVDELRDYGCLGLLTPKELTAAFYNDIKKELCGTM